MTKQGVTNQIIQLCSFYLADKLFGVNILDVKEVNPEVNFTHIFHASPNIRGYVNIRGQIHLIIDPAKLMGNPGAEITEHSRIILFKPRAGEFFGILVDRIGDVATIDSSQIEERRQPESSVPPGNDSRITNLGLGICKLDNQLMVILNAHKFLKAAS